MWILAIVGIIISLFNAILNWFKDIKVSGDVPGSKQKAGLARLRNLANKFSAECESYGIAAAPDETTVVGTTLPDIKQNECC